MSRSDRVTGSSSLGPAVIGLRADNPGPMTLEGTNTWVLRAPGAEVAIAVDPAPVGVPAHLEAVHQSVEVPIALSLLTHHHGDHAGAVDEWRELTASDVRGAGHGPALDDGEHIALAGLDVEVLATPGHTSDSVCFLVEGVLLTGDTVLGRGTSVVAWPDGNLGAYLDSLDRLIALVRSGRVTRLAPGHGPVVDEPLTTLEDLRSHRLARLDQVRAAWDEGRRSPEEIVETVYGELDEKLVWAAGLTVRAQLDYLGYPTD